MQNPTVIHIHMQRIGSCGRHHPTPRLPDPSGSISETRDTFIIDVRTVIDTWLFHTYTKNIITM